MQEVRIGSRLRNGLRTYIFSLYKGHPVDKLQVFCNPPLAINSLLMIHLVANRASRQGTSQVKTYALSRRTSRQVIFSLVFLLETFKQGHIKRDIQLPWAQWNVHDVT